MISVVKFDQIFAGGEYAAKCSAISTKTWRANRVQRDQRLPPLYHREGRGREEREEEAVQS